MTSMHHRPHARGFTLIELLTVIAIISVLIAMIGGVGLHIIQLRQNAVTESVLITLDRALDEYMAQAGGVAPRYLPDDYDKVPGNGYKVLNFPLYRNERHPARPDASVFLRRAQGTGAVDAIVGGLSEQFLIVTPNGPTGQIDPNEPNDDLTPSVVDLWAVEPWPNDPDDDSTWDITKQQLVYYVHPDNTLAQDLYGQCINRRPYFMSAGRDQKYGLGSEFPVGAVQEDVEAALDDNLYSYEVGPANRTADFWATFRSKPNL